MENQKLINLNFFKKVLFALLLAYLVLGNAEKRSTYDKLNKDLFKKDKVVTNLKKLTDTYSFSLCRNTRKGKPIQISLPVSVEDVYHGKTV